jgi:hypothetical protein
MGRRARQLAVDRFTWPNYLERLRQVYDRVLDRDSGLSNPRAQRAA